MPEDLIAKGRYMKSGLKTGAFALGLFLAACGSGESSGDTDQADIAAGINLDPFPSTYTPYPSGTVLIKDATVLDGLGDMFENSDVLIVDGKISSIAPSIPLPEDGIMINANGRWVTPGIIDIHSHLGVYPSPGVDAHGDGNEGSGPVTPNVWAEHGIWPQDPGFTRALAGGITSMQVLPGSANLFGGRGVVLKNVTSRTVQGMKFPGAPYTLKMACGENPKRVYGYGDGGFPGGSPYSRMGNIAGYRAAWAEAAEYKRSWDAYDEDGGDPPSRNLAMDTLKGVLDGDIRVHMHCYRADEMAQIIDISKEFGYQVASFHHAVESYKIADLLAEEGICSSMWADWWGFKMEAYDGIRENIPLVHKAGACAIVHSDSEVGIQRLNQEAAKAWSDGNKAGLDITKAEAWQWLSFNPAKALGIDTETGSLQAGRNADLVIWSGDPFSVYTKADQVFIDGTLMYDIDNPALQPMTDFEIGQPGEGDTK